MVTVQELFDDRENVFGLFIRMFLIDICSDRDKKNARP